MMLLIVLLAQAMVPPDEEPGRRSHGVEVAGLIERFEGLNAACRKRVGELEDGDAGADPCHGRDVVRGQLIRLGWCLRMAGVRIEWDVCPRR